MTQGHDRDGGRAALTPARAAIALLIAAMLPVAAAAEPGALSEGEGAMVQGREAPNPTAAPDQTLGAREEGMRVHIDPRTGRFVKPPSGASPTRDAPALENAMSTSESGLAEVESPTPGGGVMIELQGRFQSPLIGTVGRDGKVQIGHGHPAHRAP